MTDILAFRGPQVSADGMLTVAAQQHRSASQRLNHPLVMMLRGWVQYAGKHKNRYGSGIGEDGVLGAEWEEIGRGLLGLLNGETDGLDCGSIDGNIRDALKAEGFTGEQ